jgi:hypothetical protein
MELGSHGWIRRRNASDETEFARRALNSVAQTREEFRAAERDAELMENGPYE